MKKKILLAVLMAVCIVVSMFSVNAYAAGGTATCRPDEHSFGCVSGTAYKCDTCGLDAILVTDHSGTGLRNAMNGASSGATLLLEAGTYEVNQTIDISNKILTVIGQGEASTTVLSTNDQHHVFRVGDSSVPDNGQPKYSELTLANLTIDGDAKGKVGVYGKYYSNTYLHQVTIEKTRWANILVDNGNPPYYENCTSKVYAYDVTLDKPVELNALPNTSYPRDGHTNFFYTMLTTYAAIEYEGGNVGTVGVVPQECSTGANNLKANGTVKNPAVVSVTYTDPGTQESMTSNYESLAAAISIVNRGDAPDGDYTVTLLKDNNEDVTISQQEGVNVTVTAANKTEIEYKGTIFVSGSSRSTGSETLTFKNIKFDGSDETAYHYCIDMNWSDAERRYPHNITITGCEFVDDDHFLTAIRARQAYGTFEVSDCVQNGGFQFLWSTGGESGSIEDVNISGVTEGINTGSTPFTITGADISASEFGIRFNSNDSGTLKPSESNVVDDCKINAKTPVVIRKNGPGKVAISDSELTVAAEGSKILNDQSGQTPTIEIVGTTASFVDAVAKIKNKAPNGQINFISFEEANESAEAGDTIVILQSADVLIDTPLDVEAEIELESGAKFLIKAPGSKWGSDVSEWCADWLSAREENGVYVVDYRPVARNERTGGEYRSIQEAIDNTSNGDTITIIRDFEIGAEQAVIMNPNENTKYYTFGRVANGKTVTIDLNGKKITCDYDSSTMLVGFFSIDGDGFLTLKDSVGGGEVNVIARSRVYAVIANYMSDSDSGIVVEGGRYILRGSARKDAVLYTSKHQGITVQNGYFYVEGFTTNTPWIYNSLDSGIDVVINGGTFNGDIFHQTNYFEVGFPKESALKNNGDGTYTMVDGAAYVTEPQGNYNRLVGYVTLEDAIAAANKTNVLNGVVNTVTLVRNCSVGETLSVNLKDITIDLNGKTIEWTGADSTPIFTVAKDKTLTVAGFTPVKLGYIFNGWYTDADCQSPYTWNTETNTVAPTEGDISLYAKWTEAQLSGTVDISGTLKCGETLTATLKNSNNTGTLDYQWYREGSDVVIGTGNTYTLTENDVQKTLYCVVSSSVQTGTVSSAPTGKVDPADPVIVATYRATVAQTENGTVTLSRTRASRNSLITITAAPDAGFKVAKVEVTNFRGEAVDVTDAGNGTYTFRMPGSTTNVTVTFECEGTTACPTGHLTDVDHSQWYHIAVDYVVSNGLMVGTGEGKFSPEAAMERAMVIQVLYNMENTPAVTYTGKFSDVADGKWYTNAIEWGVANGILVDYGTAFDPNGAISREEMVRMMYNYARYKGKDTSARGDLSKYTDGATTSDWAVEYVKWAVGSGVMVGGETILNPTGNANRAEVAQIFKNFHELYSK